MVPWSWRHLPRAGVHETPNQQCIRRLSNDLYGGDGLGNGPAREGATGILDWVGFVFATWCAGFPANDALHGIFGACASGGLSHRFLLSGAATGISRLVADRLCFWCGPAAAGAADFLDDSSSLQRRVRENINAPRSATLPSTWLVSICSYGRCAVADFCGPAVPSE